MGYLMARLLIGILTYNRLDFTKKCVESLYNSTDINDFDLMIFDNASEKDTLEYAENLARKYCMILNKDCKDCKNLK